MSGKLAEPAGSLIDRVGGCFSTACAIHCSLKPFLWLIPSVAGFDMIVSHSAEGVLLGLGVFLATVSTVWGFSKHGRFEVFLPLVAAVFLIAVGRMVFYAPLRTVLVVSGGLSIAFTHLLNLKLRSRY
jgi:hypothetical protein